MKNITLVIPAKNEKESLPQVLDELKEFNYNIMVVLHSTDIETIKAIKDYNVQITYQTKFGYGDALITGIKKTKTEFFCIFNADGSFKPIEIETMFQKIYEKNSDIIFGSRYSKNGKSDDDTFITLVGNYIFSNLGKLFFNLNINDILYTFVLGKTKKVNDLDIESNDFCFCIELPIKAKKKGMNILEIGCHERARIGGKKKVNAFKDGFLILIKMINLFFSRK
jgi:glycosyltransferase involved in cell wall biosynthesis